MDNTGFTRDTAYALYVSQPHDCSYLPERSARTLFLDPAARVDNTIYQSLIDRGFRRSGEFLYQPACAKCESCVSLRIPVNDFTPNRSQRRNWKANYGRIEVRTRPPIYSQPQFELYSRYQDARHADGSMAGSDPAQYIKFLACYWADTQFYEFWQEQELVAVVVTDLLPMGLSSVYTFFDPGKQAQGLGVYALLWQIHLARELGKPWVYPGFWVEGSAKMTYKSAYRPLEAWNGSRWLRFERGQELRV